MNDEDTKVYSTVDLTAPASREFTAEEQKLIAFVLGTNAALIQFVLEGIIPANEQGHFMSHLQDFVYRLNAKEPLIVGDGEKLPMSIDSAAGDAALQAVEQAILRGKRLHPSERTDVPQQQAPVDKAPTVH